MRYPYRRRKEPAGDAFAAFRINRKMTRHASEVSTTLAVRLGSFRETRETLRLLGGGTVSTSKIRDETLCVGGQALEGLKKPAADVRVYTVAAMNAPEDGKRVERTLVAMADGTNVHCVKKDTAGIEGRNGGEAGSRQIRVMTFAEYCAVDGKGAPPQVVLVRGNGRGSRGAHGASPASRHRSRLWHAPPRMQCVADGEDALRKAFADAFPDAVFTNDVMHACSHLHACSLSLGIGNPDAEYATCRRITYRHGAEAAVDRIRRLYARELEKSEEASAALGYLDRRRDNMRYGWLRKNGYYISSAHAEAAARILVARRYKQAGMHWRHHNAACVCAIIALLRSVA